MKAFAINVRSSVILAVACCLVGISGQVAQAQTVTTTPANLSFGVPSAGSASAAQPVTVSATGSGSVTVSGITILSDPAEFTQTNNCGTPIAAPGACTINVTFTPGTTGLRSATLTFNYILNFGGGEGQATVNVPLTGAAGAFKLFGPINVANSNPNASLTSPFTFGSTTLTLTANGSPLTAVLSSSPDGSGNLLVDNFFSLAINGTPVSAGNPSGNICTGPTSDQGPNGTDLDCFTDAYRAGANSNNDTGLDGLNPDTFTNSGNSVLGGGAAGGVGPIDISQYLSSLVPGEGQSASPTPVTFTLLDGGGKVASSTLFLVTNATVSGVQTGGTITGNPINSNDPASQTPTFTFDATTNQHIALSANYLALDGTPQIVANTTPVPFDTGITQSDLVTMVHGTSAAPAVCLRLTGELDANGNALCKAFTLECTNANANTPAGANCPQSITARNLLFSIAFDTPDPINIAPGTGPGLLMGQDTWASTGPGVPKNPVACSFNLVAGDPLMGQLCPQDTLTSFIGGDPLSGGTTRTTNSTFIPVLNMPLPVTLPLVTSENIFGWQQSTTVKVKFLSSPAIYLNKATANGFTPAPIQSVTFGTTAAALPVPDTTFPVAGDLALFNPGGINGSSVCPSAPGGIVTTSATITSDTSTGMPFLEGRYNLHFFATDCASTEELKFTPKASPTANWASFKTVQVNIDMTPPAIPVLTLSPAAPKAGQTVTATFSCNDPVLHDLSPGSGVVFCGPYLFLAASNTGTLTAKFTASKTGHGTYSVTATDLAGNSFTKSVTY